MKRELKDPEAQRPNSELHYCKAHPDEKGTERDIDDLRRALRYHCKAHPDEKGTESPFSLVTFHLT